MTFASSCRDDAPIESSVCHVPEPGKPGNVWWFGFDCAHYQDLAPGLAALMDHRPDYRSGLAYRDVGYVAGEVWSLAKQLDALR